MIKKNNIKIKIDLIADVMVVPFSLKLAVDSIANIMQAQSESDGLKLCGTLDC